MAVAAEQLVASSGAVPDRFEALYAFWTRFDAPEGWRVEISDGALRMTPPPDVPHNITAVPVRDLLVRHASSGIDVFETLGIEIVGAEKLYIPDVVAIPGSALDGRDMTGRSTDVVLAVEITSRSGARIDRTEKLNAYATGAVQAYLLVDRVAKNPAVTMYSEPVDGEYQHLVKVPFGETIHLPEPFDVDLDTSQFPR
jgi:Uma2 family endonuclease